MSAFWRHITRREGVTAPELAKASGIPLARVRVELNAMREEGLLVCRKADKPGQPNRWWRAGRQPLDNLTILTAAALAARIHPARGKLRDLLRGLGSRTEDPALQQIVIMAAGSTAPHKIINEAVKNYCAA